ncbi:MAG: glycosyltransferase [Prevotellaceae bacterium]|nr:glycosyltransferase [Prevotellaceae bacterium]MDY3365233.1 glycosyltransferase [Prevotella sp.]
MQPQVSVIVAVYNAEKTLDKCIQSLLQQSFSPFEIILVNDGSTDGSATLCNKYQQLDSRVRVFHKVNGGVSSARQCGMDHAKGDYTIHVDPDDWVDPQMLSDLYAEAINKNADMVICDYYKESYKGTGYFKQQPSALESNVVLKELFSKLHGSLCNKLIRRKCFIENQIQFPLTIHFCEDLYVVSALLLKGISIAYVPQAYYHYFLPLGKVSLSRCYNSHSLEQDKKLLQLFQVLFKESVFYDLATRKFIYMMVAKAFFYGKNFYTSEEFKYNFAQYLPVVKAFDSGFIEKNMIILSCKGYYQIVVRLLTLLLKIKHIIR